MAKLSKTYENLEIKVELTFRGESFSATINAERHKKGNECLTSQIAKRFKDDETLPQINEAVDILELSQNDTKVEEAMKTLDRLE